MSTSFIVCETRAGEPLSPYSLASEESTNPPESDTSSTKSESNSPAPETSEPSLVLNSPNVVSSSFVPPPAPSMGKIEMLAVSAALRQMDASSYIDDHLDTLRSPSPETSADHPGAGTPSSPIQVDTPKLRSPLYVEDQGDPAFAATLRPKDRGPIWEDILRAAAFATSSILTFLSWAAPSLTAKLRADPSGVWLVVVCTDPLWIIWT
ncbi:hypothetical protein PTTG_30644, partial [Puccinia triticina 1-1 BBBD Race 1]